MGDEVQIPALPEKPRHLIPCSDDSVVSSPGTITTSSQQRHSAVQPAHTVQGEKQHLQPMQREPQPPMDIQSSPLNPVLSTPHQQSGIGANTSAELVITYPDGTKEVINVSNVESVRRVAKASQVIPGPGAGLSASFPQTSQPQPLDSASLPLMAYRNPSADDDDETIFPVPEDAQHQTSKRAEKTGGAISGGVTSDAEGKKKTEKSSYKSLSTPLLSASRLSQTVSDWKRLLSSPVMT